MSSIDRQRRQQRWREYQGHQHVHEQHAAGGSLSRQPGQQRAPSLLMGLPRPGTAPGGRQQHTALLPMGCVGEATTFAALGRQQQQGGFRRHGAASLGIGHTRTSRARDAWRFNRTTGEQGSLPRPRSSLILASADQRVATRGVGPTCVGRAPCCGFCASSNLATHAVRCRFCNTWQGAPTCKMSEWSRKYRIRLEQGKDAPRLILSDLLHDIDEATKRGAYEEVAHGRRDSVFDRAMTAGELAVNGSDVDSEEEDGEQASHSQITELLAVSLADFGVEERHNAAFEIDMDFTTRQAVLDRAHTVHKLNSIGKTRALRRRACRAIGMHETFRIMMMAFRALAKRDPQGNTQSKAIDTSDLHKFTGFRMQMVPCTTEAAMLDGNRADTGTSTTDILEYRMRQLAEQGGLKSRLPGNDGDMALGDLDPELQSLLEEKMRGNNGEEMLKTYMASLIEQLADDGGAYGRHTKNSSSSAVFTKEEHADAMARATAEAVRAEDDEAHRLSQAQRRNSVRGSIRASLSVTKKHVQHCDTATQTGDSVPTEELGQQDRIHGKLTRAVTKSKREMINMMDKVGTKGAKDVDWCVRQSIAILEQRAAQCASQGLTADKFMLPMDKFVVDVFGMQYGVPKLAKEKMLVFLKAVKKHGEPRSATGTLADGKTRNVLAELMYNSLKDDEHLHLVTFAMNALATLKRDMKANPVFPTATSKKLSDFISFKRVQPIIALLFPSYLPQSRTAVKERAMKLRNRGMAPEWKAMSRQRSFDLAKQWRVNHDEFLLVLLEERLRQCEVEDKLVHHLFSDTNSHEGIRATEQGKAALLSMAQRINPTLQDEALQSFWSATVQLAEADEVAGGIIFPEHFSLVARESGLHRYSSLYRFFVKYAGASKEKKDQDEQEAESAARAFVNQLQGEKSESQKTSSPDRDDGELGGPVPQLSPDDLNALLTDLGIVLTPDELAELIKKLDVDGGGTIDWPEFVEYFAEWQAREVESVTSKRKISESGRSSDASAPKKRSVTMGLVEEGEDEDEDEAEEEEDEEEDEVTKKFIIDLAVSESALMESMSAITKAAVAEHVQLVNVKPGELVIQQGDVGDCMYFIKSGTLDAVVVDADGLSKTVASVSAPDFFGERSLLDDSARSASIIASANEAGCELLMLERVAFMSIVKKHPDFAAEIERKISGYDQVQQVRACPLDLIEYVTQCGVFQCCLLLLLLLLLLLSLLPWVGVIPPCCAHTAPSLALRPGFCRCPCSRAGVRH